MLNAGDMSVSRIITYISIPLLVFFLVGPLSAVSQQRKATDSTVVSSIHTLKEVRVMSGRNNFTVDADKKIFELADVLSLRGATAVEVIKQVPSLSINGDGRIQLRDGVPVLLIDGKRTTLSLSQIAADEIKSVEVMTNPSAKYDAQGSSGIVNIILKKNRKRGVNGNIRGSGTSVGAYTVMADINRYANKTNISALYLERRNRSLSRTTSGTNYQKGQPDFNAVQDDETHGPFRKARLGMEYYPDTATTWNVNGDVGWGYDKRSAALQGDYIATSAIAGKEIWRSLNNKAGYLSYHINAGYLHRFKKEREKLMITAGTEMYNAPETGFLYQSSAPGKSVAQLTDANTRVTTTTMQIDYTNPLRHGKAMLETGAKFTWHEVGALFQLATKDNGSQLFVPDTSTSFRSSFRDPVYAGYVNYSDDYGGFSYTAGIRFEHYDYMAYLPETIRNRQSSLFPSVLTSWKLNQSADLHLNYARRVNRPDYTQLLPFVDLANPLSLHTGNPFLRPELTDALELSYNRTIGNTVLSASLYYRYSQHYLTSKASTLSGDTLLITSINAAHANTGGIEFIIKAHPADCWDLSANFNGFKTNIETTGTSDNGYSWFAKANNTFRIPAGITLQLTANYEAPKIIPQGRILETGYIDVSGSRDLGRKKQLTVIVTCYDIANTDRQRIVISESGSFRQSSLLKPQSRIVKLAVSYRFGRSAHH